jgi:hypothetical protein
MGATKQILLIALLVLTACGSKPVRVKQAPKRHTIAENRLECVMRLMSNFKEFSSLGEVRATCNQINPCPMCDKEVVNEARIY